MMHDNAILHAVEYRPNPTTKEQETAMFLFLYEKGKYNQEKYYEALKPTFT